MNTSRYASGKTVFSVTLLICLSFMIAAVATSLAGQELENIQTTASYEGQKVASVEVAGQPDLSRRAMADLISQPVNAPYRQQQVDATAGALKKSGKYTDVKVLVTPEAKRLAGLVRASTRLLFRSLPISHKDGTVLLYTPFAGSKLPPRGTLYIRTGG